MNEVMMWIATAIDAVVYGMVIVFGPKDEGFKRQWTLWGSAVVGVMYVIAIVSSLM